MQMLEPTPMVPGGMGRVHRIFMVGIGGAGMSGIAEVLVGLGPNQPAPRRYHSCLLYTSPSPRDVEESRMPSSA